MKRLVLAAALLLAGEAAAQQTSCIRPVAPVFPPLSAAATLSQAQVEQHRTTRDTFFTDADTNLSCMDKTIDDRMRTLFSTGAPMDAAIRQLGAAHEDASRERAAVYERFLRLCLAWEDAKHTKLPRPRSHPSAAATRRSPRTRWASTSLPA
jgi:hypothetical protein